MGGGGVCVIRDKIPFEGSTVNTYFNITYSVPLL